MINYDIKSSKNREVSKIMKITKMVKIGGYQKSSKMVKNGPYENDVLDPNAATENFDRGAPDFLLPRTPCFQTPNPMPARLKPQKMRFKTFSRNIPYKEYGTVGPQATPHPEGLISRGGSQFGSFSIQNRYFPFKIIIFSYISVSIGPGQNANRRNLKSQHFWPFPLCRHILNFVIFHKTCFSVSPPVHGNFRVKISQNSKYRFSQVFRVRKQPSPQPKIQGFRIQHKIEVQSPRSV